MLSDANGSFSYNGVGQLATASNANGSYVFSYDSVGRLTHVAEPFGLTLGYEYDVWDHQTKVTDSRGGTQVSVYDAADHLMQRTYQGQGQELRLDFVNSDEGLATEVLRYSDLAGTTLVLSTTLEYDQARLTRLASYDAGNTLVNSFTYGFTTTGNLTQVIETQGGVTTTKTYGYDNVGQLTNDNGVSHDYDANGNREDAGYVLADNNQLEEDGTYSYVYDEQARLASKTVLADLPNEGERWEYAYTAQGQLASVEHVAAGDSVLMTAAYTYDVFGNRIEKVVDADGDGAGAATTLHFAYDGWNNARGGAIGNGHFDIWAEFDGGNSDALTTRYVHGDGVDEMLARVDGVGTVRWYLLDSQGSVRDLVANDGTVKDSLAYDGFGNITSETDASERGRYAWTGRELDVETGLQYNRARYYDATTGRWITQDPLGFDAGDSNLYRYVHNGPTMGTDASGLQDDDRAAAIQEILRQQMEYDLELVRRDPRVAAQLQRINDQHDAVMRETQLRWAQERLAREQRLAADLDQIATHLADQLRQLQVESEQRQQAHAARQAQLLAQRARERQRSAEALRQSLAESDASFLEVERAIDRLWVQHRAAPEPTISLSRSVPIILDSFARGEPVDCLQGTLERRLGNLFETAQFPLYVATGGAYQPIRYSRRAPIWGNYQAVDLGYDHVGPAWEGVESAVLIVHSVWRLLANPQSLFGIGGAISEGRGGIAAVAPALTLSREGALVIGGGSWGFLDFLLHEEARDFFGDGFTVSPPVTPAPATSPLPGSYINTRYTINMAGAPAGSATNAAGFARNGPWFWRQMLAQNPELFSPANAAAIRAGRSPVVDATWVAGNPTHQSFLGQRLIHHHIDQGGIATGLPESIHQAWHGTLHPN